MLGVEDGLGRGGEEIGDLGPESSRGGSLNRPERAVRSMVRKECVSGFSPGSH